MGLTASPPAADAGRRPWVPALGTTLILTVAVCSVYAGAIHAPFIFDDRPAILDNPSIRRLWPPIGTAAEPGPLNPPLLSPTLRRPLPNLTFALNYRFGAFDPAGYHLVNLFVHVLAAAVLAAIVRGTLRLPYFGMSDQVAWALSTVVALLWALHPLGSEAVVYVTQRTEQLMALGYLTALWASLRYWLAPSSAARRAWVLVAGLASVCGMASKEAMISAPLTILLCERTFLVDSLRACRRSWPLYASLALGWITLLVLLQTAGIGGLHDARHQLPVVVWWVTQVKNVLLYLRLAVWPWPLAIHYTPDYLRTVGEAWPWVCAVGVLAAGVITLVWRRPAARFAVLAAVLAVGPTMVVPLPKMMAAERRMYLPLAGLVALAVVGVYRAVVARRSPAALRSAGLAAAVVVAGYAVLTAQRVATYRTAVAIWQDSVLVQPNDAMSHYNLGVALLEEEQLAAAIRSFERAVQIDPEYTLALDNLGGTLDRIGRMTEAVAPLEAAVRLDPADAVAHNNLGAVLVKLGRADEALGYLQRALALMGAAPDAMVYVNLGRALMTTGRFDEAIAHFEQAIRLAPADAEPHRGLANVLLRAGRTPEAIVQLERAVQLDPGHGDSQFNLGRALLEMGRPADAAGHFQEAARLDAADVQARFSGAVALARSDRRSEAIAMANDALALARAQGNAAVADEIESWVAATRAGGR